MQGQDKQTMQHASGQAKCMHAAQVITGSWSKKAHQEAGKYVTSNAAAKGDNSCIPPPAAWKLTPGAKYVHYCDNETIQGVEFHGAPGAYLGCSAACLLRHLQKILAPRSHACAAGKAPMHQPRSRER
jgi:phosphoserine aminotransferase